jgi:hypothetical protein
MREKGDLIKVTGKKVERWDLQCSWCCRTEGGSVCVCGGGGIFETETHIRLLSTCVCVCVREREREGGDLAPPKVCKKELGDPNTMGLLV